MDKCRFGSNVHNFMGVRCNHTRSSPRRAPNMAKSKTRKARTSIKYKSKKA